MINLYLYCVYFHFHLIFTIGAVCSVAKIGGAQRGRKGEAGNGKAVAKGFDGAVTADGIPGSGIAVC